MDHLLIGKIKFMEIQEIWFKIKEKCEIITIIINHILEIKIYRIIITIIKNGIKMKT
jgi:hypothetical protein